jgi:hypothetical protein
MTQKTILIIFLLFLAACQPEEPPTPATPTIVSIPKVAITPTNPPPTSTKDSKVLPTVTEIPFVISTATPPMEPTQTPRTPPPTLSPEEAEIADKKMFELYETNANCQLPCWWGFIPGETTWTEAKSFLSTLTNEISTSEIISESNPIYFGEAYLFSGDTNYYRLQIYVIQDDIIEKITAQVGPIAYPNYTLAKILSTYGTPNEIWISSYGYSIEGEIPFTTVLFYSDAVMLLKYYTNASLIEVDGESIVRGCIQDKSVSSLGLWPPDEVLTFEDAVNETTGMNPSEGYLYRPLEDVTDMTIDTFYQTFLEPNAEICIETPAEIWVNDH